MTLTRPSAVVTLDGQRLTSAEGAVARVRVHLGLGPAHDLVECICWPSSKLKGATAGGTLTVALGGVGEEQDVFSGEVSDVRLAPDGVVIEGLAATIALSRSYVSQSFLDLSIADIVQQLADAAGVAVDDVSGDTVLSAYAVDDRRPVWGYINELAQLAGADVVATVSGALKFAAPASADSAGGVSGALAGAASLLLGGASTGLRFGANVIDWRAATRAVPDPASVAAYGSGSESGSEKWHWIRRDQDAVGSGRARVAAAASTRDAASAIAGTLALRARRAARRSTVTVTGDASLRPGQVTQVRDLPGDAGGELRIVAAVHALDGDSGFRTRLILEAAQ